MDTLGGRKFIFGLLLIIIGFVFTILKMVEVNDFFTFAEVVGATYVIGNVGTKIADGIEKSK